MKYSLLLLLIILLACGQPPKEAKVMPSIDTTDIYAEKKAGLDSLFLAKKDSAAFSEQDMWTSLLIGHLFTGNRKHAAFRYFVNDSVAEVVVLGQSGNKWDTVFFNRFDNVAVTGCSDYLQVTDFNGDNIPDLKVVKEYWDIHIGEHSDLWLYRNDHFIKVDGFDKIVSAEYDKNTRLIYSYQSQGCSDMAMYFGVFKINGTGVKNIKEMYCSCCPGDSGTIEVFGQRPFSVGTSNVYKYVPQLWADGVKEKCR